MKKTLIQISLFCLFITSIYSCTENDINIVENYQPSTEQESRANVNTYYINQLTYYCEDDVKPYLSELLDDMYREEYSIYYYLFKDYIKGYRELTWIGIDPTLEDAAIYDPVVWTIFFQDVNDIWITFPEEFLHHIQSYFYSDMGTFYQIDYEFEAKFARDLCDQENNNGACYLYGMGRYYPGDYSQLLDAIYYKELDPNTNLFSFEGKGYYFFLDDFVALGTYSGYPYYSEPLLAKHILAFYDYWY